MLNVASGKNMSISDIVKTIVKVSGKNLEIKYDTNKPSRDVKTKFDISKVKNKYGWKPEVKLEDILNEIKKYN